MDVEEDQIGSSSCEIPGEDHGISVCGDDAVHRHQQQQQQKEGLPGNSTTKRKYKEGRGDGRERERETPTVLLGAASDRDDHSVHTILPHFVGTESKETSSYLTLEKTKSPLLVAAASQDNAATSTTRRQDLSVPGVDDEALSASSTTRLLRESSSFLFDLIAKPSRSMISASSSKTFDTDDAHERIIGFLRRDTAPRQGESVSDIHSNQPETSRKALQHIEGAVLSNFVASSTTDEGKSATAAIEPLALAYNECSMAAIANWVGKDDSSSEISSKESASLHSGEVASRGDRYYKRRLVRQKTNLYPVASSRLRRCLNCGGWGHYELQCTVEHGDMRLVDVASELRKQILLRDHLLAEQEAKDDSVSSESYNEVDWTIEEEKKRRYGTTTGPEEQHYRCYVCESAFRPETLLICDGCNCLCHLRCTDPPLESVPNGPWFCSMCERYDEHVDSDVEIEGCDGFIIEQRKRSRQFGSSTLNPPNARISRALSTAESKSSPKGWDGADIDMIDGFTFRAVHESTRYLDDATENPLSESLASDGVVAWFPQSLVGMHGATEPTNQNEQPMLVGILQGIKPRDATALVRVISDWEEVFARGDGNQAGDEVTIQQARLGAACWVEIGMLHAISLASNDRDAGHAWATMMKAKTGTLDAVNREGLKQDDVSYNTDVCGQDESKVTTMTIGRGESHANTPQNTQPEDWDMPETPIFPASFPGESSLDETGGEAAGNASVEDAGGGGEPEICHGDGDAHPTLHESSHQSHDIFEVENIRDHRRVGRRTEFLIKWKGYPIEDCTWEPEENILNRHV